MKKRSTTLFLKLIEKEIKADTHQSSLETKEKDFSVLIEKPSKRVSMKIQSLVDGHSDEFEIKKQDNQLEMEEKQRLFLNDLKLNTDELGKKGGAHTLQALAYVYVDLNVTEISNMNPRLPSLDADARLILREITSRV